MFDFDPWVAAGLLALGAWHGLNPGMGWLLAVALGLQEARGRAVWRALPPLAVGHALAVALAVTVAAVLGRWIPMEPLRWIVAGLLIALGLQKILRSRHPGYGGMRVGLRQLTVWSFLMATAHGAGLMVVPFVLGTGGPSQAGHAAHGTATSATGTAASISFAGLPATLLHTAGYLAVTALVALVVYRWVGLRWLRTGWINLDLIWGVALIATGAVTPLLP